MSKSRKLAMTAIGANAMVWFGLAAFCGGFAVELSPDVFAYASPVQLTGWVLLVTAAVGLASIGVVEVSRLSRRLRRSY